MDQTVPLRVKKWRSRLFKEGDRAEFGPQSTFSKILQRPHRAVVQNSIVHAPSMGALHNLTYTLSKK
jgi:hypothetical protein